MFDNDSEEPGNVGNDDQNLDPIDLDSEQLQDLIDEAQAVLDEELAPV